MAAILFCRTVYPKKHPHGFCFAVLCCGYILTDFPISIKLTSLALWQSNDCPSASKATLVNLDRYFIWIHYEQLHNHNKAKHNKTMCIFLGIYCRCINTLRPRQDGRYFAYDVLKCIFLNENVWISLKIPLKFVPKSPVNNIPALVQIMAWRRPGDKPLSEPMLVFVPTHICVTRPQWVNPSVFFIFINFLAIACSLFGMMLFYMNQHWLTVNFTTRNNLSWNLIRSTRVFFQEIVFEAVDCQQWSPLFRLQ